MTEIGDVLLKRAAAEANGTTPIFYNDEVDALLAEIKRLNGADSAEISRMQAANIYRLALAVLCRKSKRKNQTIKIFARDLERLEGRFGSVLWRKLDDGGLELRYAEGPANGSIQ